LGAYLMDTHVGVAGLLRLLDRLEMTAGIGPARHRLRDPVLGDHLERGFEVRGRSELREQRALEPRERPYLVRRLARPALVLRPAHAELDVARMILAARGVELRDEVLVDLRVDHRVARAARELRGAG